MIMSKERLTSENCSAPKPLEKLESLARTKKLAFLGLFAGARMSIHVFTRPDGKEFPVKFGKTECELIDDWRDFYKRELPSLGLTTFTETEPRPALGMSPGSTFTLVTVGITDEGWQAREAYWEKAHYRLDDGDFVA